jgi:hypothetical protein
MGVPIGLPEIWLDSPFDVEMALHVISISASVATGQGWLAAFSALEAGLTMVEAHGHPVILYGLLEPFGAFGYDL